MAFGVGRLLYKMRMRKPLDEAVKWFNQSKQLSHQRNPLYSSKGAMKFKNITIKVEHASNLKHTHDVYSGQTMRPYFSYCFYSFPDVYSATLDGKNPNFGSVKHYEVELNE